MKDHKVDRLYIKLFDVEVGEKAGEPDWKMVPVATTVFKQKLPGEIAGSSVTWKGKRHYLLANVALVGEAIMLAMRTATDWRPDAAEK